MARHGVKWIKWLPKHIHSFKTLCERGVYSEKDYFITKSVIQAIDMSEGNVDKYTLQKPAPATYAPNAAAVADRRARIAF